jgi:hemolysin activation/secretion protein
LRNDWSVALGESGYEAYLALDVGEVSGPSSQNLLGNTLTGGVIGLRGTYKKLQYDLFVGGPIDKPAGFRTASTTPGFSLSLSL